MKREWTRKRNNARKGEQQKENLMTKTVDKNFGEQR